MTMNKRGLGRGLEALLANVMPQEAQHLKYSPKNEVLKNNNNFSSDTLNSIAKDHRTNENLADKRFINNSLESIYQEKADLLFEAESLIKLIDEFEIIVRNL